MARFESVRLVSRWVVVAVLVTASGCGQQPPAAPHAPARDAAAQPASQSAEPSADKVTDAGPAAPAGEAAPVSYDQPAVVPAAGLDDAATTDPPGLDPEADADRPAPLAEPGALAADEAEPLASDSPSEGLTEQNNTVAGTRGASGAQDAPAKEPPARVPRGEGDQRAAGKTGTAATKGSSDEDLFVGWPKPQVALVFTGQQWGFLEPCGCSGLENQKGGLIRRYSLLKQLAGQGWPLAPIDAGNQVRRFGRQSEIKFSTTYEGLAKMGYGAIAFGPDDLRLPATELVVVTAPTGDKPSAFVCANVTVLDPSYTSPYLVIEKGGKKIGVTAVLGERNQQLINNSEITFRPSEEALNDVWPKLQDAKCDLYVLIAHATMEESIALAEKFPQFPLVVSTGGAGEPTLQPDPIQDTKSQLIQIGTKGMYACVVGMFDDPAQPLRYQRVPLDARFPDSEEMLQLLATYQDQLKEEGLEGLGIRPQPHPTGREFVGSASCKECHAKAWKVWKEGLPDAPAKHSHAYATLQKPPKRAKIPRNFDPECLSCHVVGWNSQKYFPYKTGYLSLDETPNLTDVGCENCHGPGKQHVDAEKGDVELSDSEIEQRQKDMVLTLKDAEQKCLECHDLDNSPAFQEEGAFDRYWAKIKH
jgi:hypothetical protein